MFTPATDLAEQLRLLRTERALAVADGLAADAGYLAELAAEIALTRRAYVIAAVCELAALAGPRLG